MTTARTDPAKTIVDAIFWSTISVAAGMAVSVWAPRTIPYIAGALVVSAVTVALIDRVRLARRAAE